MNKVINSLSGRDIPINNRLFVLPSDLRKRVKTKANPYADFQAYEYKPKNYYSANPFG